MKTHWKTFAKFSVSSLLLAAIFTQFRPIELWETLSQVHLEYLVKAALITPLILLSKTFKWYILAKGHRISFAAACLSLLAGLGVGLVTPGRAGELARVVYLRTKHKSELVAMVIVDRLADLITIVMAGAIALCVTYDLRLGLGLASLSVTLLILILLPKYKRRLLHKPPSLPLIPWRDQFNSIIVGLFALNRRALALVLILAILTFSLGTFQFYWLLLSLEVRSMTAAFVSFPILTLAGVIPFTISGIGIREGAAIVILSLYQISDAVAVNATLMSFTLNTLLPGVLGLIIAPGLSVEA